MTIEPTVSDAEVEAAARELYQHTRLGMEEAHDFALSALLAAARARSATSLQKAQTSPAAIPETAVKPLEWEARALGQFADTPFGAYWVSHNGFTSWWARFNGNSLGLPRFDTEDEAKAAAQSDYEARIRSALTHPDLPDTREGTIREIAAERARQVSEEGWTVEHDDQHTGEELARAAACYACPPAYRNLPFTDGDNVLDRVWPWDKKWWKPANRIRNLIKAGALIVAEIERLRRLAASPATGEREP
jgi:hypothetical protein